MNYIEDFADYLKNERELMQNTLDSYLRDIRIFEKYLKDNNQSLDCVTKTGIITYLIYLQKYWKSRIYHIKKSCIYKSIFSVFIK